MDLLKNRMKFKTLSAGCFYHIHMCSEIFTKISPYNKFSRKYNNKSIMYSREQFGVDNFDRQGPNAKKGKEIICPLVFAIGVGKASNFFAPRVSSQSSKEMQPIFLTPYLMGTIYLGVIVFSLFTSC